MNLCVTGGAGYIGSFITRQLCERGHRVLVVDDLSKGHAAAVDGRATLVRADCGDSAAMADLLGRERVEGVVHMAAVSEVGESVREPIRYYRNNFVATLSLIEAMRAADVGRIVFSSTAAVYGQPEAQPIGEDAPARPINPYGHSKRMAEQALADAASAHGLGAIALRYFNAAGAAEDGSLGEDHDPETHLAPLVPRALLDRSRALTVFGDDYPTPDGTCVRDYIHVLDLADAHVRAIEAVRPGAMNIYNLGNGAGFSVLEVIETAERVVGGANQPGLKVPREIGPRRAGDPPVLVASADRIRAELGWRPTRDLARIIADAWAFHASHRGGYGG